MATNLHTATAQGAIEYLDSLVAKNRVPASVVSPLKTALSKVLQRTEGAEWGRTSLLDLDVGDIMMRFKQLSLTEYSEGSYRNYEMRLKKAIGWYLKFLRTPGWTPPESSRSAASRSKSNTKSEEGLAASETAAEHRPDSQLSRQATLDPSVKYSPEVPPADTGSVTYPFPLQSGKTASLQIPRDITADDVRRLHGFLDALVIRKEGSSET